MHRDESSRKIVKTTPTQLGILLSIAAIGLAGCANERRDCVDAQGNKLPDSACARSAGYAGGYPRYIYGGTPSGNRIVGGSSTPRASGTTRGGFGSGRSSGFGG